MTDIEIIKELFKAYAGHNEIVVELNNDETIVGEITSFDGEKVTIGCKDLPVSLITCVRDYVENQQMYGNNANTECDINELCFKKVVVNISGKDDTVEGLLYAISDEKIVILTSSKKVIVEKANITEIHEKIEDIHFDKTVNSVPNLFEEAIVNADRDTVFELLADSEKMLSLGYSLTEIVSMTKTARMPLPWNDDEKNRLYNQGRRIYEIEGNRGNIAYTLFADFLKEDARALELRSKSVGTILDIMADTSACDLLQACNDFRELIVQKDALCYKAAILLLINGMVESAQKFVCEERIDKEVFRVDPFDDKVSQREIFNILLIPNKYACNQLLSLYSNQDRQKEYFSIIKLMLPDIREDMSNIETLRKQFKICDGKYLNEYLVSFPLLWMDSDIASRYIELNSVRTDLCVEEKRLMEQCLRAANYGKTNELEDALVRSDFNSFEVLRSNNSILFSCGYNTEEIAKIREVDSSLLQKKTIIERLLLIEGNRHFVAESYAWKDYFRVPKTVCTELFPILLTDGNGALVYELFNYSGRITEQLKTLKPLYIKALVLLDYKEEFWEQVKDEWISLELDSEEMAYAISVAEEKEEKQHVAAMEVYSQLSRLNDFELALVKGNAAKLRTIVADVNNLAGMGYNSEDISLILESTRHRVDFKSDDKVSIANRVFAFQKNKNNVAEFYYKMALLDGDSMAAYGLFSVYENEKRHDDLCTLFAIHLADNENMITSQMRGSYLLALYETQRFAEFIKYYNSHKEETEVNSIILLEVLLSTKSDNSDISKLLLSIREVSAEEVDLLKRCIQICLVNSETSEFVNYAVTIFNIIFEEAEQNDVMEISCLFEGIADTCIPRPIGSGIIWIKTREESYLKEWCEYHREKKQDEKSYISMIERIDALVVNNDFSGSEILRDIVLELYQLKVKIPKSLMKYLIPEMNSDDEKIAWLDNCLVSVTDLDELKFTTFCDISNELGEEVRLKKLIYALSKEKNCKITNLKKVIIGLLEVSVERNDIDTTRLLLNAIMNLAGNYQLFGSDVFVLFKAYIQVGNREYAYIADRVLETGNSLTDDKKRQIMDLWEILGGYESLSLFTVIEKELYDIRECRIIDLLRMWKGLFKITEEDTTASEELRDYYNTPEKWSDDAKNLLAKHLFCNYKSELYWKLVKQYYSNAEDEIKLNIEFQFAKTNPDLFGAVIMIAQKQKLYGQLVVLINYLLAETNTYIFDECYKYIFRTLSKCPGVIDSPEIASMYIHSLFRNDSLSNSGKALRFVLEVAESAGSVSFFAEKYINDNEVYDYLFVKKLLCKLLLEECVNKSLVENVVNVLKTAPHDVAYTNLLIDMCASSSWGSDDNKAVLRIIQENEQETLDEQLLYRLYTSAVIHEKQSVFINAVDQIKKYYPELSVYDDLKKYEMTSKVIEDDKVLEIYSDEYARLVNILAPDRMLKTMINMLPGDIFLTQKNIAHDSVYDYGMGRLSATDFDNFRYYHELYTSVCDAFKDDIDFLSVFMKSCFLRQWEEVVLYDASSQYINDILKSDHSIKKILLKRHYEVLKWVFLSLLDVDTSDDIFIERAYTLLSAASIVRFNKNTLRRLYKMDDHYRDIVRKIFSIRMESATLRKLGYVGKAILEIEDNEKVAYLICMLPPSDLSAIFNNDMCYEALMNLPVERAQHISEIYVGLFSEGRDNVFSRAIASIESNNIVFTLSKNPYDEDDSTKYIRKKYRKQLEVMKTAGDTVSKMVLRNYELIKAEYLYSSVKADSTDDINEINPSNMDYISVITMLFNRKSVSDIKDFVWKLSKDMLLPLYSYIMQLLEQYVAAYKVLKLVEDEEWINNLSKVQYRAMRIAYLKPEEIEIRNLLKDYIDVDRSYWLGKFVPVEEEQVPVYVEKMNALYSFRIEFMEYLEYNGINISDIELDEEKFVEDLRYIQNKYSKKTNNEITVKEVNAEGTTECVGDYLDNDILETMLNCSTMEPARDLEHSPQTYEECIGIIKFYATVKRESKNKRDILLFKDVVRWAFLKKMDEEGYSRDKFLGVLNLISKDEAINKSQWHVIVSYMVKYFEKIENLSQMSRMLENDLSAIQMLACDEGSNIKLFRKGDLKVWRTIESVLSEMSGVDYLRLSELEQMQRLTSYRNTLLANGNEKETSSFSQINNKILRLINAQITGLKNSAEIVITVLEENRNQEVSIVWEKNNNVGHLYAIISNNGGANCENVILTSKINVSKTRTFEINKIYPGEKIPFRETFRESELSDGKLTWDLEVSYYDANRNKQDIVMHHVTVNVEIGNDILNLGNINTGNPAKGKNFIGRTHELALLRNRYSDEEQLPSMLIRGLKRSGKSSILIQFTEYLKNKNQFVVVLIDGQSVGDDIKTAFFDKVIDGIRMGYRSVEEYHSIINNELNEFKSKWQDKIMHTDWVGQMDLFYFELSQLLGKKILVVVDEMESIFYNHRFESIAQEEALYAALRALIQKSDNYVSFVFCGSDTLLSSCLEQRSETQMFQTLQYLEVGHMNHGDIQEIYRRQSEKYEINFTPDAVETIWEYTDGLVWYAKLLGYLVINNIFAKDLTIRKEVNRWDILHSVQMLINGEIGTDKYDLVDACLNTPRTAIVHAMAGIMPDHNKEVSVDEIFTAVKMMKMEGYINPRTGEKIPELTEESIKSHLEFLDKMQFVEPNSTKTKYQFTAELYRLFFRTDKKLHMFEERGFQ